MGTYISRSNHTLVVVVVLVLAVRSCGANRVHAVFSWGAEGSRCIADTATLAIQRHHAGRNRHWRSRSSRGRRSRAIEIQRHKAGR